MRSSPKPLAFVLAFTLLVIAGCASAPPRSPALDEAQAAYDSARANPDVLRHARDNLDEAAGTLARADSAETIDDMDSLAYVAHAQVRTAEAIARRRVADARIGELSAEKRRVELEAREAELAASRRQLAELQARQTDRGTVITLGAVLFATGRSDLAPGAAGTIERLARYLQDNPQRTVLIEGHTDSTGSDWTNLRLSQDRADAVRLALMTRGIAPDRLTATGLGPSQPIASNETAAGRQQNRRVEIIIQ
jgi:OmpA-OmpF porin, OOP family